MKKSYSYDPKRFQEILNQHNIRQVDVQKALGYTNTIMVRSWRDGNDLYAGKLCQICNIFGIDIHEFFVPEKDKEEEKNYQTDFEKKLSGMLEQKLIEEQKSRSESNSGNGGEGNISASGADLDFWLRKIDEAREKERTRQEEMRMQEREKLVEELNRNRKDFDREILEKSKEILEEQRRTNEMILRNKELEMKLEAVTRKCNELELSSYKGGSSQGIAENGPYACK